MLPGNYEGFLMQNPTMLYKTPGPHSIHGGFFDYKIIDGDNENEVKLAKSEGWHFTTEEALNSNKIAQQAAKAKKIVNKIERSSFPQFSTNLSAEEGSSDGWIVNRHAE